MKKNKFVACCTLLVLLAGCAQTASRHESTVNGVQIGAMFGAAMGASIGAGVGTNRGGSFGDAAFVPIGILVGAAVGALIGGLIGYFTSGAPKPAPAASTYKSSSEREAPSAVTELGVHNEGDRLSLADRR